MTRPRLSSKRSRGRGLSLIELMVSLVIGLIIVLATLATYLGSSNASRVAEAQGRMNEDAQAALTILTQQLRMVGNNPKRPNRLASNPKNPVFPAGTYTLRGCDGNFTGMTPTLYIEGLSCASGVNTLPDSVAISYEADTYNTVATSGGAVTDCLGQSVPAVPVSVTTVTGTGTATISVTTYLANNLFYIGTSTSINNIPSLYCRGNGGANAQPLVENIENLQFLYGTAPASTPSGVVTGYLTANEVETSTAADAAGQTLLTLSGGSPARWLRPITVRICVIARSENPVAPDSSSAQYLDCDNTLVTNPPDLRLRRAYSTTVVLRNRL